MQQRTQALAYHS